MANEESRYKVLSGPIAAFAGRAARFFALVALVPLIIGFIDAWSAGFGFLLFIIGIFVVSAILAVGTGLWMVRGVRLPIERSTILKRIVAVGLAPALLLTTLILALPLLRAGEFFGSFTRLMVNRGHYEQIIAKVRRSPSPAWYEDDDGVTYSTDLGPPVRVAFNPEGMLDNWSGIIYDPTGDVMQAKGFDPGTGAFVAPDRITKLFGGDLVGCRHLWAEYYTCSFT